MVDSGFRVDEGSIILYDTKWVNFNGTPCNAMHTFHFLTPAETKRTVAENFDDSCTSSQLVA